MKEIKLLVRDLFQAGVKFAVAYPFFLVAIIILTVVARFTWFIIRSTWNLF